MFRTVLITIAAALASRPEVGSSMKMIEGLATNSTAMVSLFRCPVDRPFTPEVTSDGKRSQAEKIKDSYTVRYRNVPFNISTGFPPSQDIHQRRFTCTTNAHESCQNTRPESPAYTFQKLKTIILNSLNLHLLAPTPSQYQYASGKSPRYLSTRTPNGSDENGRTFDTLITVIHANHIWNQHLGILQKRPGFLGQSFLEYGGSSCPANASRRLVFPELGGPKSSVILKGIQ
nr:hypothetical protein MA16_Dca005722 [Ipomoea trifida]